MEKNTLFRAKIFMLLAVVLVAFVLPAQVQAQGQVHVVSYGDTLYSIARRYRTTVTDVKQANGLRSDRIYPGQLLMLPSSE